MDGIGKIIFRERERAKISQHELCNGICSVATLSRLEWSERNIGKWNIDILLQRLGKSQDKFWTIVHVGDYEIMELRRTIWDNILRGNYAEAQSGIWKYEHNVKMEKLHKQFLKKSLGMIKARRDNDWTGALEFYQKSLAYTVCGFKTDKVESILIGRDEMQIILLMAEAYAHLGEEETAKEMVRQLLKNLQKKEWDEEEKAKIYPKAVSVYTDFLKKEDRYEEVISLCETAVEMLVSNGIIFLMSELLEKIIWGMERGRKAEQRRFIIQEEQKYQLLEQQIQVLKELWKEYGNVPEECMRYCTNVQKDISVSNEIIRKCRKICNLSQEKASEDVCTVEQLSRIETGKCSPLEKNYRGLMEKMNQAQERNRFFVNAQEYSLHEKIRQIEKKIAGQEIKKAAKEWKRIREEIPKDSLNNQQYIARYDAIMKRYSEEINQEKYIQQLEEALRLTMPEFEIVDIKNWPLSRNEIFLLANLANAYCGVGRMAEAKHIYHGLWDSIEEGSTDRIYHITEYRVLAHNMGVVEGLEGNFSKAREIFECGIQSCMIAGRDELLPRFLYCLGWIMREEGKREDAQKARHIIKQAFYIANLLKLPNLCNEICNYYEEEWNDRIVN